LATSALADDKDNHGGGGKAQFESGLVGSSPSQPIAGIPSGGAPWKVAKSEVKLAESGDLKVEFEGLLLSAGASVDTVGPVTMVKASLVCGGVAVATTAPVGLSPAGDAKIEEAIVLPASCVAPAVLVRIAATAAGPNATGPWIAATGFMTGNSSDDSN
jgi:hypothetical protein